MSNKIDKSFSLVIFIITVFFANTFYSCKNVTKKAQVEENSQSTEGAVFLTEAQQKLTNLTTARLSKIKMGGLIHLSGKTDVSPQNQVSISAPLGGFIKSMPWMSGMKVTKGQVIAVIENKEFIQLQQDYLMAKSAIYYAEKELERQKELTKTQATSDKLLLQAEEIFRLKKTELRGLEEKLKLVSINPTWVKDENITSKVNLVTPVNGYISNVNVNIGKYVQPTEAILDIIDNSKSFIILKAFEKDLPYLKIGNVVTAHTNNLPDKKYKSKVSIIGSDIKSEGYVEVTCMLDINSHDLIPGTYMNAEIESSTSERWAVQEEAVITFEGVEYVFAEEDDNTYHMIKVETGLNENGFIEIINHEVVESKKLVSKGAYTLLMKMKNVSE